MNVDAREAHSFPFVTIWLILLMLAGLSAFSAFFRIGVWAPIAEFGIAGSQAFIIFLLFMRLKGRPSFKWFVAGTGFFWLIFLYGLSMTDYATRSGWPAG